MLSMRSPVQTITRNDSGVQDLDSHRTVNATVYGQRRSQIFDLTPYPWFGNRRSRMADRK